MGMTYNLVDYYCKDGNDKDELELKNSDSDPGEWGTIHPFDKAYTSLD